MRKALIFAALAMGALAVLPTEPTVRIEQTVSAQVKRRKVNKAANKLKVFYGYASDRKGKGQKKREASARRKKGW